MADATTFSGPSAIGRYEIESVIGRGAMGVIYKAHDPNIGRKVAVKLVRADLLDGEDRTEYIARFRQEAQAAGRCSHPNIVAIHDFDLHEGNPFIAMEFIDGVALNQVMARTSGLSVAESTDLVCQMLDGLGAAHSIGVVHRDIKPANIMLTAAGQVKVTDFGVSRLDTSHITGAGAVVGTPSYMSPEQCRGETVDGRSDLFSAGVLLFELLTRQKPFAGRSSHEVWNKLLNEDPPDPAQLRPDLPPSLAATLRRALAKPPQDRFQTAAALRAALAAAIGTGGGALASPVDLDRTVTAARAFPPGIGPGAGLDEAVVIDSTTLGTIERGLARHVGPIAHFLLKSAVRKAESVEALCADLSRNIEDSASRESFREEIKVRLAGTGLRSTGVSRTGTSAIAEADLARATAELTRYAGPIARVLVKRAAPGCPDLATLWVRLAQHVERPADRAAFAKLL